MIYRESPGSWSPARPSSRMRSARSSATRSRGCSARWIRRRPDGRCPVASWLCRREGVRTMIETGNYVRFERVTAVDETERGLLARLHGEQLRIDVIRDDLVRVKISRGGTFDEAPTFAVCVDPLAEPVDFTVTRDDDVVRLRTPAIVVSLGLDPFRLDVHRAD